jgi:peptidyl-tRNA hydrolase, PTH1 family
MKLIVGLGNPGKLYQSTRHNMGYMVVDMLAKRWQANAFKEGFQGEFSLVKEKDVILFKPTTFMNLSGHAVVELMNFYKLTKENVVIIYDDLAFEPGVIRLRMGGSSGSHNGIEHIIEQLNTEQVKRIRIGIGPVPLSEKGRDYVLGTPSASEFAKLSQAITLAVEAVEDYLQHNFLHAMSRFNRGSQD